MGDLLQPWHILLLLFVGCILLVPVIFYILTLQGALNKCSTESRTLEPGMLWLLLDLIAQNGLALFCCDRYGEFSG